MNSDTRALILDKTKERMERFGYKKTTMDEISKDCKISKKTIYEYFTDKETMFRCLIMRECRHSIDYLFSTLDGVTNPLDKLVLLIQNAVQHLNQDHFMTQILKDDELLFAFAGGKYYDLIGDEVIGMIANIIREGKQTGQFRDVNEEIVAYAGFRLVQVFSYGRTGPLCAGQDYTAELTDFLVHGIAIANVDD